MAFNKGTHPRIEIYLLTGKNLSFLSRVPVFPVFKIFKKEQTNKRVG